MNVYKIQNVVLLLALIFTGTSLSFKLLKAPICLKFSVNGRYFLEYVSSGKNLQNVKLDVYENSRIKITKQGQSEYHEFVDFTQGEAEICFQSLDHEEKVVSFEFYHESDPFKAVIDKKDFHYVLKSLSKSIESMKEVGRNQQFHIQRDEVNKEILEKSEVKIKWTGIIKIFFLLASALIQLWIMKGFFKQNSMPYQPLDQ